MGAKSGRRHHRSHRPHRRRHSARCCRPRRHSTWLEWLGPVTTAAASSRSVSKADSDSGLALNLAMPFRPSFVFGVWQQFSFSTPQRRAQKTHKILRATPET